MNTDLKGNGYIPLFILDIVIRVNLSRHGGICGYKLVFVSG